MYRRAALREATVSSAASRESRQGRNLSAFGGNYGGICRLESTIRPAMWMPPSRQTIFLHSNGSVRARERWWQIGGISCFLAAEPAVPSRSAQSSCSKLRTYVDSAMPEQSRPTFDDARAISAGNPKPSLRDNCFRPAAIRLVRPEAASHRCRLPRSPRCSGPTDFAVIHRNASAGRTDAAGRFRNLFWNLLGGVAYPP